MPEPGLKPVKCLVWDLDNTLWDGVLLEDAVVRLRPGVRELIEELDRRGILHSVASRSDEATAIAKLEEFGLRDYFLRPQVTWNPKSWAVGRVAEALGIGTDALAFVDDDPFERQEVQFSLPAVRCLDPSDLAGLLDDSDFTPPAVTPESAQRRLMYVAAERRDRDEAEWVGPKEEFLAGLGMVFTIAAATDDDLARAEELTVRTHQLNTTGRTYSYDELRAFIESDRHLLLMASLDDRYGSYGKIGLALVEQGADAWTLKLLLMSCRVLSRGVGSVLLNHVMHRTREAGRRLRAELVPNERNRVMMVTLRFAGFREVDRDGDVVVLESDLARVPPPPVYVDVRASA